MAKTTTSPGPAPEAPRAAGQADPLPTRGGSYTVDPETGALVPTDEKGPRA